MSVDPLAELFTGHSPYIYSFNNPVMYSDPSGLAPEKENRTMASGSGGLGASISQGYWTTVTTFSYNSYFTKNLDNPLNMTGRTFHSDETIGSEDLFVEGISGGGGAGGSSGFSGSSGGSGGTGQSSRRLNNDHSLNRKSHQQQDAVSVDMKMNTTKTSKLLYKDMTDQFNSDLLKTKNYFDDFNEEINGHMNWKFFLSPIETTKQSLDFFKSNVGTGEKFDLKQKGKGYSPEDLGANFAIYNGELWTFDDFGNYNYGVAARAFGFPLWLAIAGAGYNQTFQTGSPDFFNPFGFFDHKRDTDMIKRGYNHYGK